MRSHANGVVVSSIPGSSTCSSGCGSLWQSREFQIGSEPLTIAATPKDLYNDRWDDQLVGQVDRFDGPEALDPRKWRVEAEPECLGLRPRLVRGHADNIKVTNPEDATLAEAILRARKTQ